jgi:hypothetical protein
MIYFLENNSFISFLIISYTGKLGADKISSSSFLRSINESFISNLFTFLLEINKGSSIDRHLSKRTSFLSSKGTLGISGNFDILFIISNSLVKSDPKFQNNILPKKVNKKYHFLK